MMKRAITFLLALVAYSANAEKLLIPMDTGQTNHLKAYGIVFNLLSGTNDVDWLLNYKGGSFAMNYTEATENSCITNGVKFSRLTENQFRSIVTKLRSSGFNGDVIRLEKAPKIAVYTPSGKKPWDDAVTMVLVYAGIPFDKLYADEVLAGDLSKYTWLHLHHEDFTGQSGKFWAQHKDATWYQQECKQAAQMAARHGFSKVSQLQLAVAKKIRDFVAGGGSLFAMCSATDTYDIALAANGTDICDSPFDGDGMDPQAQSKLNFDKCFAFTGFTLSTSPYEYEYATIDNTQYRFLPESTDRFTLVQYNAKRQPIPSMLTQNHTNSIKGFMGQTTSFRKQVLKPGVTILGECNEAGEARYIHGTYKEGSWTYYGGHDPEDYRHIVGEPPTDLSKYPNSPGYRLILNNVLSPGSGKKDNPVYESGDAVSLQTTQTEVVAETRNTAKLSAGSNSNSLIISFPESEQGNAQKIRTVTFLNAAGTVILTKTFDASSVTVAMDRLPMGTYTINVNGKFAGRVVKN
jgi:hypothetical protein